MSQALVECPFGSVRITWRGTSLAEIELDPEAASDGNARSDGALDPLPPAIAEQLSAYFADPSASFDLPLEVGGTPFQRRVWEAIRRIPAGQTRTYGELARELSSAARAVGQACRANPCPIVVPCHRVVGKEGLGGFAGDASGRLLEVKRWLLSHEGWVRPAG